MAVKQTVVETVLAVKVVTARMSTDDGATAQAVGKILRLDKSAARRRLIAATNEGFIRNLETRKGQPGRYRTTSQEVEHAIMLPPPEQVQAAQGLGWPILPGIQPA